MSSGPGLLLLHFRSAWLSSSVLIVELYDSSLCCGMLTGTDEFSTSFLYFRKDSVWFWLLLFVWNRSAKAWAMSGLVLIYLSLYFIILGIELNLFPLNVLILFHIVVAEVCWLIVETNAFQAAHLLFLVINLDSALAFLSAMWSDKDFVFLKRFNFFL